MTFKFKILDIKDSGANIHIGIQHKYSEREVFGIPKEKGKEINYYLNWIRAELNKRNYQDKIKIDPKLIGKEIIV